MLLLLFVILPSLPSFRLIVIVVRPLSTTAMIAIHETAAIVSLLLFLHVLVLGLSALLDVALYLLLQPLVLRINLE